MKELTEAELVEQGELFPWKGPKYREYQRTKKRIHTQNVGICKVPCGFCGHACGKHLYKNPATIRDGERFYRVCTECSNKKEEEYRCKDFTGAMEWYGETYSIDVGRWGSPVEEDEE